VAAVDSVLSLIGQSPELFALVSDAIRSAVVKRFSHVVYYRVHPDRVEVVAVLRGSRDPNVWQSRI
jgi:plasmid stabilization system protein ParE